ncbi:MAG: hypothetical protein AB8B97_11380 [Granulosicoccus sp.]
MSEQSAFTLHANPDWSGAAQALINSLNTLQTEDERIEMLEAMCVGLGDRLYPAFLQILYTVEHQGSHNAKSLVARTLVDCLISGRLPMGTVAAWGSSRTTGDQAFGQSRRLGPIEYLCVWHAQGGVSGGLNDEQLRAALGSVLRLVSTEDKARHLYIQKLRSDAANPLSGSLASKTRQGIDALAQAWESDLTGQFAVEPFLLGLQPKSLLEQISRGPADFLSDS